MESVLNAGARARVPLILFGALILQTSMLEGLRSAGIPTDALLLVAVTAGAVAGPERGAWVGFAAGLLADLFLQTPLGLSALAYCLVGFGVGVLSGNVIRAAWWIMPVTAFVGSAAGVVTYAIIGSMVGQPHLVRPSLTLIALSVGLVNLILSLPVGRAMTWALGGADNRAFAVR
jgi:rod shape-determining protein MreD